MIIRKILSVIILGLFIASCSNSESKINRPNLPIFYLNENATDEEILRAYRKSLDLMIIYTNQLENHLDEEVNERLNNRERPIIDNNKESRELDRFRESNIERNSNYTERDNYR